MTADLFNPAPAPIVIEPREYQAEAVQSPFDYWSVTPDGYPLIVLPTAAGKTIVTSLLMERLFKGFPAMRILFLAHRKELISQTEAKLLSVWPEAPVGVYSASLKRRELRPITVASRDTIAPVLDKLNYKPMLVIIDEAHNVIDKEGTRYRKIIEALEDNNPDMRLLGVTATPFDGKGYIYGPDKIFTGVCYELKMRALIDQGYLAPLVAPEVDEKAVIDTSAVKLVGGEFHLKQLEAASINHDLIAAGIDEWVRLAVNKFRKYTLFFCVSVAHAEAVQIELATRGYEIPIVTGKTPQKERDNVTHQFLTQKLRGIINVGVFTEGSDFPLIDCICNFRAVHSLRLWLQMAGRGMRISPDTDKDNCLMLDFGGCVERFGPIDIAQPPQRRGTGQPRTKTCPNCELIINIFDQKCVCGHEFEVIPPHKTCPECGEQNPPGVDKCVSCGHIFINHDKKASREEIMSSKERYRKYTVIGDLDCRCLISSKTKQSYLHVRYPVSISKSMITNIMIGYDGFAGKKAIGQWKRMMHPGTPMPTSAEEACRFIDAGHQFKNVDSITVDMRDKWKAIISVDYSEEQPDYDPSTIDITNRKLPDDPTGLKALYRPELYVVPDDAGAADDDDIPF